MAHDYLDDALLSDEQRASFRKLYTKAGMSPRRHLLLVINGVYGQLLWARINNDAPLEAEKERRLNELFRQATDMGVSIERNPKTGRYVLMNPKEEAGKSGEREKSPFDILTEFFEKEIGELLLEHQTLQSQYRSVQDAEMHAMMAGEVPTNRIQAHYNQMQKAKQDIQLLQSVRDELFRRFGYESIKV